MRYRMLGDGVLILKGVEDRLSSLDAIIFDCDGTLVDAQPSYNLTVKLTTMIILREVYGLEIRLGEDVEEVIYSMRLLGGFNNDWYIASALIQAIFLEATAERHIKHGNINFKPVLHKYLALISGESRPGYVVRGMNTLRSFVEKSGGRYAGHREVNKFLWDIAEDRGRTGELSELRRLIGINDRIEFSGSILAQIFDEIYLGREGLRVRRGVKPRYVDWPGAIENERILISHQTLASLRDIMPKGLGMVTGRGAWETWKTLGHLRHLFREEGCFFISDTNSPEFEKPSPKSLLKAAKNLGAEEILYVGNSAEDLIMTRKVSEHGLGAIFAGIIENEGSLGYFINKQADIILDDVNLLPKIFQEGGSGSLKTWRLFSKG